MRSEPELRRARFRDFRPRSRSLRLVPLEQVVLLHLVEESRPIDLEQGGGLLAVAAEFSRLNIDSLLIQHRRAYWRGPQRSLEYRCLADDGDFVQAFIQVAHSAINFT